MKQDSHLMWSCWKKLFLGVLDKHTPLQHKRSKSFKVPWLSKNVKDLIYERDKLKVPMQRKIQLCFYDPA